MSDFNDIIKRATEISDKYGALSRQKGRPEWSGKDTAMGFVGDVGELMQLIAAKEGVRDKGSDVNAKLGHELADCLWSVIILAKTYNVNLEAEFNRCMDELDARIAREQSA